MKLWKEINLGIIRVLVASTPAGTPGSRVQTGPENWHSVFPHLQYIAVKLAMTTSLHVSYNSTLTLDRRQMLKQCIKKAWLNTQRLECIKQSTSESCVGVQVMIVCVEIPVPIQIQFKGTRVYVERGQN